MKISTTIKEEKFIEKEIELPYFCNSGDYFFKMVSGKEVLEVVVSEGFNSVKAVAFWLKENEVLTATECTEEEFNKAYSKALGVIDKAFMMPEPTLFDGQEEEIAQTN